MAAGFSNYEFGIDFYTKLLQYINSIGGYDKFRHKELYDFILMFIDEKVKKEISEFNFNQGEIVLNRIKGIDYISEYSKYKFGDIVGTHQEEPYTVIEQITRVIYNYINTNRNSLTAEVFTENNDIKQSMRRIMNLVDNLVDYCDSKYADMDKTTRIGVIVGIIFGSILVLYILSLIVNKVLNLKLSKKPKGKKL